MFGNCRKDFGKNQLIFINAITKVPMDFCCIVTKVPMDFCYIYLNKRKGSCKNVISSSEGFSQSQKDTCVVQISRLQRLATKQYFV